MRIRTNLWRAVAWTASDEAAASQTTTGPISHRRRVFATGFAWPCCLPPQAMRFARARTGNNVPDYSRCLGAGVILASKRGARRVASSPQAMAGATSWSASRRRHPGATEPLSESPTLVLRATRPIMRTSLPVAFGLIHGHANRSEALVRPN